jgi:Holliday junction resolvase RusA-like endonuclease
LHVPGWRPATVNELLRSVAGRIRLKKSDREMVATYARLQGIPLATVKRRVSLCVTLGPRERGPDPDGLWKSLLDALVHAGLLLDDNCQGVELGAVEFVRGQARATAVALEDLDFPLATPGQ